MGARANHRMNPTGPIGPRKSRLHALVVSLVAKAHSRNRPGGLCGPLAAATKPSSQLNWKTREEASDEKNSFSHSCSLGRTNVRP